MLMSTLFIQAIMFVASLLLGVTGFGNAMIAMPLLLFLIEPSLAIPMMKTISLFSQLAIQFMGRFPIDWRLLWILAIPAGIGTFVGAALLKASNPALLTDLVAFVIIGFAVATLLGFQGLDFVSRPLAALVGFIAGILGGAITLSGPPVVLFVSQAHAKEKDFFRGTLLAFFTVEILASLVSYVILGILTREHLILTAQVLPVTFLGLWVGYRIFSRFSNERFRKVVLGTLVILSLLIVFTR